MALTDHSRSSVTRSTNVRMPPTCPRPTVSFQKLPISPDLSGARTTAAILRPVGVAGLDVAVHSGLLGSRIGVVAVLAGFVAASLDGLGAGEELLVGVAA
jgi:hypothetical protein